MAERDGLGFAAVFTADTQSDIFAGGTAFFDSDADEFTDTLGIKHLEGIVVVNAPFDIVAEEFSGIVAGETAAHLGQVIGTEREEFRFFCDPVSRNRGTGNFDHGTDLDIQLDILF